MNTASIEAAVTKATARDEQVRKILLKEYGFTGSPDSEVAGQTPDDAARLMAADCGTRLFNVLYAARNPSDGVGYTASMDLIVHLNTNPFWAKHGAVLMPLLHAAMHAQADYASLLLDKATNPNLNKDDEVRAECKLVGLELFPMIAFLLSGPELMMVSSLKLKRQLAPLLG